MATAGLIDVRFPWMKAQDYAHARIHVRSFLVNHPIGTRRLSTLRKAGWISSLCGYSVLRPVNYFSVLRPVNYFIAAKTKVYESVRTTLASASVFPVFCDRKGKREGESCERDRGIRMI